MSDFRVVIKTDAPSFSGDKRKPEIARILHALARGIETGILGTLDGIFYDTSGESFVGFSSQAE